MSSNATKAPAGLITTNCLKDFHNTVSASSTLGSREARNSAGVMEAAGDNAAASARVFPCTSLDLVPRGDIVTKKVVKNKDWAIRGTKLFTAKIL